MSVRRFTTKRTESIEVIGERLTRRTATEKIPTRNSPSYYKIPGQPLQGRETTMLPKRPGYLSSHSPADGCSSLPARGTQCPLPHSVDQTSSANYTHAHKAFLPIPLALLIDKSTSSIQSVPFTFAAMLNVILQKPVSG